VENRKVEGKSHYFYRRQMEDRERNDSGRQNMILIEWFTREVSTNKYPPEVGKSKMIQEKRRRF
jgi:hypothetical protein